MPVQVTTDANPRPCLKIRHCLSKLSLNPCRAAFGKSLNLRQRRHRRIAGESRQKRPMRPAKIDRLLFRLTGQQSIDQPSGEAVSTPDAIHDVQLTGWRQESLAIDPGDRAPT